MSNQNQYFFILFLVFCTITSNVIIAQDCTAIATGDAKDNSTWNCTGGVNKPSDITDGTVTVPSTFTVTISNNQSWNANVVVDGGTMVFGGQLKLGDADPGCDYSLVVKNGGVIEEGSGGGANERLIICDNTIITSQEPPPSGAQNWPSNGFSDTGFDKDGENNSLLPVELLSFFVKDVNGAAEIRWETASELNNDYFNVQKSENGKDFFTIGTVPGKGTTNIPQQYSITDNNPIAGICYYRLIQTDFDGSIETFRPVVFENQFPIGKITVVPNPVEENNTFNITGISGKGTIMIINAKGEEVYRTFTDYVSSTKTISPAELTSGIYYVRFSNALINQNTKFIVK